MVTWSYVVFMGMMIIWSDIIKTIVVKPENGVEFIFL